MTFGEFLFWVLIIILLIIIYRINITAFWIILIIAIIIFIFRLICKSNTNVYKIVGPM